MAISQKCQYALRGIFELAKRRGSGPITVNEVAEVQAIPARFLELIFSEMRQAGFVESRRGARGGYILARRPNQLTVGEVVRAVEGSIQPVVCLDGAGQTDCPLLGSCVFLKMWQRAGDAVAEVYDSTTFQDLIDEEQVIAAKQVQNYCI